MIVPSLVTFGSLSSVPDKEYLSLINSLLLREEHAIRLINTINDLPDWWDEISRSYKVLQRVPGHALLERLRQWLVEGTQDEHKEPEPNVILAPLTIITHLIEYLSYLKSGRSRHANVSLAAHTDGFQGLCIGQLSAVVLASAEDESELIEQAAVAIRLAVLIGATVDLDGRYAEVPKEWACIVACSKHDLPLSTIPEKLGAFQEAYISVVASLSRTTITLPQSDIPAVTQALESQKIEVRKLGFGGRFHTSAHSRAAEDLKHLCDARAELQFKRFSHCTLAVRSGSEGRPMTNEHVHRRLINDILLSPSDWHGILTASLQAVRDAQGFVLSVGRNNAIPDATAKQYEVEVQQACHSLFLLGSRPNFLEYPEHAVAIIGMGCKFPGAASTNEFWEMLKVGKVMASKVPSDRFPSNLWGNFVDDVASFDHKFFGKSPREAAAMDPQQRLLLEVAYQAVESAGWYGHANAQPLNNNVGCFIGCGSSDYNDNMARHTPGAFSIMGALRGLLSGRVSHHFGWTGPSITCDAACASSMAAIHAACQALQLRECESAVAGGVNVLTSPSYYNALNTAGFLSKTGSSKAFDTRADGYCRGEGAGLVVLKRLDDALASGDRVISVISATSIMQNQGDAAINVPSVASQMRLFRGVLDRAKIDATQISFVEAHGTGTQVGDCIEAESVRQVFGTDRTSRLYLGSVKDNIGHTEGAAGVAGLIKTLLMMQNDVIIPQPSFERLNSKIAPLENNHIEIAKTLQQWSTQFKAACVNNYGAGGCNGALIVCQYPLKPRQPYDALKAPSITYYPISISAKSADSLRAYLRKLKQWLESQHTQSEEGRLLADVAFSLSRTQNRDFEYAVSFVTNTISDLCCQLASCLFDWSSSTGQNIVCKKKTKSRPLVLVFGGQTGRYANLSPGFVQSCTLLRSHILHCDRILQQLGFNSIFPFIFQDISTKHRGLVDAHNVLFSIQYATAKSWLDSGLEVAALLGHSFGQITALCVAGVISLEDAFKFVAGRASLIEKHWGEDPGAMVAVEADRHTLLRLVDLFNSQHDNQNIEIACYNGPTSFVLAGPTSAIDALIESVGMSKSIMIKKLDIMYAFHSSLTDPILPGLTALAEELHYGASQIPVETCSETTSWTSVDAAKLVRHTRSAVHFGPAIQRLQSRLGSCTWLEAGYGSPVIGMAQRAWPSKAMPNHVFHPSRYDSSGKELAHVSESLAKEGHRLAFWPFHTKELDEFTVLNLPPYQFERHRHWLSYLGASLLNKQIELPVKEPEYLTFQGYSDDKRQTATFNVDPHSKRLQLLVRGHAVLDTPLCPASAYIDIASQAAAYLISADLKSTLPHLEDLCIEAPLGLDESRVIVLTLTQIPDTSNGWWVQFESNKAHGASILHVRAKLYLRTTSSAARSTFSSFQRVVDVSVSEQLLNDSNSQVISGPVIYGLFGKTVAYDRLYRGLTKVASAERETAALIKLPQIELPGFATSLCDPVAMDNFLQVAGIHVNFLQQDLRNEVLIASHIDSIMFGSDDLLSNPTGAWLVYAKYSRCDHRSVTSDIFVFSLANRKLKLILLGVRFTRVHMKTLTKILRSANTSSEVEKNEVLSRSNFEQHSGTEFAKEDNTMPSKDDGHVLLCAMLSSLLDVPPERIQRHVRLADLGVDSLMMTEVATSIRETFNITIATMELQALDDVEALSQHLFGASSETPPLPSCTGLMQDEVYVSNRSTSTSSASSALSSPDSAPETDVTPSSLLPIGATETGPSFLQAFQEASQLFDTFATESSFLGYWDNVHPLHSRLVTGYIVRALAALGCPLELLSVGAPLPDVTVHSRHDMLYSRLLEILEDYGIIHHRSDGTVVRSPQTVDTTCPAALHAQILLQYPIYTLEHQLLKITGECFADCLTGHVDGVDLLFGSRTSRELLQQVYENAPIFRTATLMLARFLVDASKTMSPTEPIQILEIGAGTGGTTMFVVKELLRAGINFIYTFTDLSTSLVSKAKQKFSSIENMRYRVLDIEKPVPAELHGQYHTVISTNCIHATPDLVASCQNIKELLRPAGVVALVELTRKMPWFDVVFGLLEGWWAFTDDRTHALVNEHVWDEKLRAAGFPHVEWSSGASKESSNIRIICGFNQYTDDVSMQTPSPTIYAGAYAATSIPIQSSTSECTRKIFAFPGGFGTAATYTPLPVLAPSIALYGLNSPFLKSPSAFDVPLSELARLYLDEIRCIQPRGPYTLMGYSVGGVVAYEAARQLIIQGEEVRQLILLDSACPALIPPFPLSLLDFFDGIDRFKGTDGQVKISDERLVAHDKQVGSANGTKKMADPHVIATLQSLHRYKPLRIPTGRSPQTLLIAARHGVDRSRAVSRPKAIDSEQKVLKWVLDDRNDFTPSGFGWDKLVDADKIEVVPVDGNHFSLMTEPFITRGADELRKRLDIGRTGK